jgi:hypothetical protein
MRLLPLLLLCVACGTRGVGDNQPPPRDETQPTVVMDSSMQSFLAEMHNRWRGHATLPDHETIVCVLGNVKADSVIVYGLIPPRKGNASATEVYYWPCEHPDYIGTWHPHFAGPWGDGCWHSTQDMESFNGLPQEIIALVSCIPQDGTYVKLMSQVKRGYSKREKR